MGGIDFNIMKPRDFVNTRLLVHKHVKISVDEWILETTRPHKQVTIFGLVFANFLVQNKTGKYTQDFSSAIKLL